MKLIIIVCCLCFIQSLAQNSLYQTDKYKSLFDQEKTIHAKNPLLDNYDVCFYHIDIEATNLNKYISGKTTIKAKVVGQPLTELLLQLHSSLTVDSVYIDNIPVNFQFYNHEIHAFPSVPIPVNNYFTATVVYKGTSLGNGIKNGQSPNWQKKVTWTLSESYHAMDWFPCKQDLNDKADSAYIFITCNSTLKAGSNGILKNITVLPNNKVRYEWKTYYPIAYYLISFTISEYQEYNIYAKPQGFNDSILIQNFIYDHPNYLPYFQNEINRTKDFIELLSELWGIYPFYQEKYGHCTAPIGGGMEHQTMSTMAYFNFELVIHELAHQWFGDYVTCATWQDIWINEGFATYSYYIGLENLTSFLDAQQWMFETHNDIMSLPNGSIYIPFSDVYNENRIFDYRLTYQKGAAIIHTIRYIINNDSVFYSMLKSFLQHYSFGNATGNDFKNFANTYTGINFDSFFNEWYYGEGYPTYSITWNQQNDTVHFTFIQQTSAPSITNFFTTPVEIKFSNSNNSITHIIHPQYNYQQFSVYVPFNVSNISIDPNNYIINKVGSITTSNELGNLEIVNIYPNPANNFVNVQTNTRIKEIKLYNTHGQEIKIDFDNQNSVINTTYISPGIYLLKINNYIYKLIKL
jgi:aminopeptidase N